tara:strand:- start:325 stop:513 length:189 start_codon:yes stop_codon:yes gene_type:complete
MLIGLLTWIEHAPFLGKVPLLQVIVDIPDFSEGQRRNFIWRGKTTDIWQALLSCFWTGELWV